jgi:DNA-directed RNA polymerase specialized sigma24 family protein
VARIMGVKETDVTNFLHRARDRLAPADAND